MVHYWISVFAFAGRQSLLFVGKSRGGIIFDVLVIVLDVYWLKRKHSWSQMKIELKETLLKGVSIACIAALCVYICEWVNAPPAMQASARERADGELSLRLDAQSHLVGCASLLTTQTERARLLGEQKDSQQSIINSDQSQLNSQQSVVAECVVDLAKMNPKVREEIEVSDVLLGVMDSKKKSNSKSIYSHLLILTTNETREVFRGILHCPQPTQNWWQYAIILPHPVGTVDSNPVFYKLVDDNTIEVHADTQANPWSPAHPAIIGVESVSQILDCNFSLKE